MATARHSQVSGYTSSGLFKLSTLWSEKTHELVEIKIFWQGDFEASIKEQMTRASEFVEGLAIEQIFNIDWNSLFPESRFPLFPWLLRSSYQLALNPVPAFDKLSSQDSKGLLCRCFGVYERELQSIILKDPSLSVQDLSSQTNAGLGCTTCLQDIKDFLFKTRERFELTDKQLGRRDKNGLWVRPMGMTPAEAVLKLAPLLKQWCLEHKLNAEMVDLCGHQVRLKGELGPEQLKSLQRYWESHLGVRFAASLFL